MADKRIILDNINGAQPEDFMQALHQLNARGYTPLAKDPETQQFTARVAQQFLPFLMEVFEKLGLHDIEISRAELTMASTADAADVLRDVWNKQAPGWPIIETPQTYLMTMMTLLEHLRFDERKEVLLSIGSGPGLYETFLAELFHVAGVGMRIHCIDFAKQMTKLHAKCMDLRRVTGARGEALKLRNITAATDDMRSLSSIADASIDQILCNNAVQWCPDWRKAVAQMARVIKPGSRGYLYSFIHPHAMHIRTSTPFDFGFEEFSVELYADALEQHHFELHNLRQFAGKEGSGQFGGTLHRIFILARHNPGTFTSWRDKQTSAALSAVSMGLK